MKLGSNAALRGAAAALALVSMAGAPGPAMAARGWRPRKGYWKTTHRRAYRVVRPVLRKSAAKPASASAIRAQRVVPVAKRKPGLVREALQHRGTPYVWGGASRGGFDCSGFTRYLFLKQRGIELPHSASAQARLGVPVPTGKLRGGDLLFFSTYRKGISHVGMYLGNGRFIHAANRRQGVRIASLNGYYARRLKGARRLVGTVRR